MLFLLKNSQAKGGLSVLLFWNFQHSSNSILKRLCPRDHLNAVSKWIDSISF